MESSNRRVRAECLNEHCFINLTPLQLIKGDKAPSSDHYMVARAAGPPGKRIILFDYIPSRTKEALRQLLIDPDGTPGLSSSPPSCPR